MSHRANSTPRQLASATIERLSAHADPVRACSLQRWFKEPVNWYGVENQIVKQLKQDAIESSAGWTFKDAVAFCEFMVVDPHMEARGIGFQIVGNFVQLATPDFLPTARKWLETVCENWGLVDNLAQSVVSPLVAQRSECIKEVVAWAEAPSVWLRRGAAVAFIPLVSAAKYRAVSFEIADRLAVAREDTVQKAVGWLLKETGKVDPEALRAYILENGHRLSRTTIRGAIERFPAEERKKLLKATRKKP